MNIAIVYMVAGMSSRFGGRIKGLVQITEDKTLIETSLDQALPAGFTKIVFITSEKTIQPFKEKFKESYQNIPVEYCIQTLDASQRDKPWGTADAICSISNKIDCPFVVCNGDDLYGKNTFNQLANHLRENKEEATIGYLLKKVFPKEGKVNRGIFEIEGNNVTNITEMLGIDKDSLKEKGLNENSLCSMNIYALHPETLKLLKKKVDEFKEEHKDSRTDECLIQVEMSKLLKEGRAKMKIYPSTEQWIGVTNPGDEKAVIDYLEKSLTKS